MLRRGFEFSLINRDFIIEKTINNIEKRKGL